MSKRQTPPPGRPPVSSLDDVERLRLQSVLTDGVTGLSLLPDLRSNKFEGQANFVNPGIMIAGLGLDADLTPKLRGILNANYLRFDKTGNLDLLLFQPGIRKNIGLDLGAGFVYRPLLSENVVITAGVTGLIPGSAFEDLFTSTCAAGVCGSGNKKLWNAFAVIKLTY